MTATERNNGDARFTGEDDMSEELREVISEKTRVPIGIAIGCAIAFIGGAVWLNSRLDTIDHRLSGMERSLLDRWTARDMQIFALEFQMKNPDAKVPDVNKIKSQ